MVSARLVRRALVGCGVLAMPLLFDCAPSSPPSLEERTASSSARVVSWTSPASPIRIRDAHTATLLGDGRILVAGGGVSSADTTELFEIDKARFVIGPTMTEKRKSHTATLLQSGKVLLVGGEGSATSELFDPTTMTFTRSGGLAGPRAHHAAVRLTTGKVLVVAGDSTMPAEIYDPATEKFTVAPSPPGGTIQSLVTLASGDVLALGTTALSMIFDPTANAGVGAWRNVGAPHVPTVQRTGARMFDGRVLVTRTEECQTPLGPVYCNSDIDLFDPAASGGKGATTATFPSGTPGSSGFSSLSLLPSGQLLLTGSGNASNSSVVCDVPTQKCVSEVPMGNVHVGHTATVLPGGDVMVFGGKQAGVDFRTYPGVLTPLPASLVTGRLEHASVRLRNGKVLLSGGDARDFAGGTVTTAAELFDPTTRTFAATGSMVSAREFHDTRVLPSGDVLVTGGTVDRVTLFATAEIYDTAKGTFRAIASMKAPHMGHATTVLPNGEILLAGGCGTTVPCTEIFDPVKETFRAGPNMLAAHKNVGLVRLPTGKILVVGGATAELFDPVLGTFTATLSPGASRDGRTAHLLPNGKVFLAGGGVLAPELYDPGTPNTTPPVAPSWTFTAATSSSPEDQVWRGTIDGRMVASGGKFFETVANETILYDSTPAGGASVGVSNAFTGTGQAVVSFPSGLLITGGEPCWAICIGPAQKTAFVWEDGAPASARPVITNVPASVAGGAKLTIQGQRFTRGAEGSVGNTSSSPTNSPTAIWMSEAGDAVVRGKVLDFTDTSATFVAPATALYGKGWLHVSSSGVTSAGVPLEILPAQKATTCAFDAECGSGFCTDGVCCDARCDGKCEGCTAKRKTQGEDGVCGSVPPGHDQCFVLQGESCKDKTECATGDCVEGVCCDSTCTGACLSCTKGARVGVCGAISEGSCDVACDGDHSRVVSRTESSVSNIHAHDGTTIGNQRLHQAAITIGHVELENLIGGWHQPPHFAQINHRLDDSNED